MATQNRTTKPQPTQGSAAARQAAQAPAADAAKMAKQAADKAELDKLAQAKQAEAVKEVVAETTAEGSVATADAAAAAEGSLGAVSGEAAVAEAGAAGAAGAAGTAAAISPLAIGAGVVGVAAVAAAAGGGSSGGSSSQPIAQNNTQQAAQNQGSQKPATPAAEQPAQDTKPAEGTNKPAEGAKPAEPAKEEEPAKQADSKPADQPKVDPTPVEDLTKPATAGGTAEAPTVAADGVTNLTKFADLFKTAGAKGGEAEHIKITRVYATESTTNADARVIDYDHSHAYEVIDAGKPITLAEAQAMATKLGGKLLSIDTADEKAWLYKNLIGHVGHQKEGNNSAAAWMSSKVDADANALIRTGSTVKDFSVSAIDAKETPLSHFVIEYENYQSPLLLDGKPVVDGQIINKADAGKLAWNADQSKVGEVSYQAVDSDDADTAKPVPGSEEQSMGVTESPDVKHPMTGSANPGAQDKPAQGSTEVKPANDAPQADKTGQDDQNSDHQPAKQELPATAQGTAEAPQVATTGETQLTNVASAFEKAAGDGKDVLFIKIVNVDTSEGEAGTRIYREVETTSKATGKAPDAPAPAKTTSITAYEVIDAGKPISRAEAEKMAEARGGKLLSIDSDAEAKFIGQNLFGKLGEYDGEKEVNAKAEGSEKEALQAQLNKQLADNGAWLGKDATQGAVANADAIIRNGNAKDQPAGYKAYDFSGEKLSRFVIEIENYKAPLTLHGKPVENNQIIHKSEFDKLVWNGDHNTGGKITYVAVQSGDVGAANVEGAEEKTLTVTESAAITHPTAPATDTDENPQQGGNGTSEVQDNKAPAGGEGQKGEQKAGDPQKGGEHGADDGVHKADTPQNSTTGSDANKGNTNPGSSKTQEGGSDSKAGDTTQDGGSKSPSETNPPSKPAGTTEGQTDGTVNQPTQPPVKEAPSYEPNKSVNVAHDVTDAKIAKEVFEGTNPANKPEAVKATGFAAGALKVDGAAITDGALIKAADFDKVTWDASKGEGGSFKFTPVQANGDALAEGGAAQTITINEAPAPVQAKPAPTYDANKSVDVAHDVTDAKIAKEVFEGTTPANKPAAVTVTGFTAGTLKVDGQAINPGEKIAAENFDKVTWDASKGEGGSFKFTPVQANGDALEGATEQTITINEAAAAPVVNAEPKVGEYPAEAVKFDVAHDALKGALTKDSQTSPFAGTNAEKAPDAVKIVSVQGPDGENTHANIMTLGDGGSARNLTAGQFIDKADFSKVQWNASVDHGSGTYKVQFVPVTSDHQEIAGAQTQTFTVKEAAEQPDYSTTTFSAAAEHNGDATFGKAMFDGTDAAKAPMFIRITEISPNHAEEGDHRVLHLVGDHAQDLKVDDSHPENTVLRATDFENLRWDASHNEGGTFKFTALDGDMKPIDPSAVHTVTVTEKGNAAPLAISHQSLFGASEGQGQLTTSVKSLAHTPAEPSSNLLDDLHNQITPLI